MYQHKGMRIKTNEGWELFHHMADMGVRGYGSTVNTAFENAALALTAVITDVKKIKSKTPIPIACEAPDLELLLADWLNALIYQMAVHNMLFAKFDVAIKELNLTATAWGEKVNVEIHRPAVEVKGATYTTLKVYQQQNGVWVAQTVVDV